MTDTAARPLADGTTPEPDDPLAGFFAEIERLGVEHRRAAGEADLAHLKRLERWGIGAAVAGTVASLFPPNPLTTALIAQGQSTRFLMMHHISHKGYDKVPGVPERLTSKVFARGRRRVVDWLDWIPPDAWHVEHDHAHHYHLGEESDPDVLDRNTKALREAGYSETTIRAIIGLFACAWTLVYYGPRTMAVLHRKRDKQSVEDLPTSVQVMDPRSTDGRETLKRTVVPNGAVRFVALPAIALMFGRKRARNMLLNVVIAEVVRNLHLFLVITPSHTASDLRRFDEPAVGRREFIVRQIIGSANYRVGGDVLDFAQLWLNYQIEHHVWPDLTMLQYREVQPKLAELCERNGVPYLQESVWTRLAKTLRVLDGSETMVVREIDANDPSTWAA